MTKILLAEDDTDMRRFLLKALQNAGFDVISYDNGLSAYQRLREEPFELLLTDIVMPEMDGIELARSMPIAPRRAKPRCCRSRFICASSSTK
jgi:two-component system cell cycle response regulator CpdR